VAKQPVRPQPFHLQKCPTGITGLDELTQGGLPGGRPTLVTGSAGSGKTLLALQFLVKGATEYNEPGVFMAFEETSDDLTTNVASLGFDLDGLTKKKKLAIDYVYIERSEIEETGEYDLEGLFVRLGYAIDSIGAKRVVLDTIEVLFGGLPNEGVLRAELRRLFRWLKDKGVTALITGERGGNFPHPLRPRRVRCRLRHSARPPDHRPDVNQTSSYRQVPRLVPRHQ
jgi:circadian clock protein KaiC